MHRVSLLSIIAFLLAGALLLLGGQQALVSSSGEALVYLSAATALPAGVIEPTAVVLSSFSATLEGPTRTMWTMSATLLVVGFIFVLRFYPRKP